MLSNRHLLIALLVAPVLSVLAWFAVGRLAGEQPAAALPGQVYPLLEKSNCRYASGRCEMVNGNVELELQLRAGGQGPLLELQSSVGLQGVLVAVVGAEAVDSPAGPEPQRMGRAGTTGTLWRLPLATVPAPGARLRLVAATGENRFTADVATRFIDRDSVNRP